MVTATAAEMLRAGEDVVADDAWAYTGSMILADGRFLADTTGTLIGFVHDPASIIEHVNGLGIGHYGLLGGNTELVPEEGTPVTLTVRVLATETTESN